jgi:hypothetical protein
VQSPKGVGARRFILAGPPAMIVAHGACVPARQVALRGKHGVMARLDHSASRAAGPIASAEPGARLEYMDLRAGGRGTGLPRAAVRAVAAASPAPTALV